MEITDLKIKTLIYSLESKRRQEILVLVEIIEKIVNRSPKLWGTIIGFGKLYYKYPTGHDGFMPIIGLASRKNAITLYLSYDIGAYPELNRLGKYSIGKSCLYIKKLTDVDLNVLKEMITKSYHESITYDFVTLID